MTTTPDTSLYTRLRSDLLQAARHHRHAARHPGFATDIHASHLAVCRRQLGALRQAYHRTQAVTRWNDYARRPRQQDA